MLWWQKRCHVGVDRAVKYCGGNQGQHPGWDKVKYTAINGHNCRQTGARDHKTRRFGRGPHKKYFKIWDFDDWQALKKTFSLPQDQKWPINNVKRKKMRGGKKETSSVQEEVKYFDIFECVSSTASQTNLPLTCSNMMPQPGMIQEDAWTSISCWYISQVSSVCSSGWWKLAPDGTELLFTEQRFCQVVDIFDILGRSCSGLPPVCCLPVKRYPPRFGP